MKKDKKGTQISLFSNMSSSGQNEILEPTGHELMKKGMGAALENANRQIENWGDIAYDFLVQYFKEHPNEKIQVEKIRQASVGVVPPPPNNKAWGGIVTRAKSKGIVIKTGVAPVTEASAHRGYASVWQLKEVLAA